MAEARARKRKRAMSKLKAAKNQANLMAQNSEMSEKAKIKVHRDDAPLVYIEMMRRRCDAWYLPIVLPLPDVNTIQKCR